MGNNDPIICLDLDGVCVDFVGGLCDWHNIDMRELYKQFPNGVGYDLEEYFPVPEGEPLFHPTFIDNPSWWAQLNPTPWFADLIVLVYELVPIKNVYVVSSPGLGGAAEVEGKLDWMKSYLPLNGNRWVLTPYKHLLARPNTILIDDYDEHIGAFSLAGGRSIVCPRPWNTEFYLSDNPFLTIKSRLVAMVQRLRRLDKERDARMIKHIVT